MDYVIATARPWNEVMAQRLAERTGHTFHLITRKDQLTPEWLKTIAPRYVFFPHWSFVVPETVHEAHECVIFHMTDLPYGRGGSPLQNLIQRGRHETNITALRCVQEVDAGLVYLKRPLCLAGSASEIFLRAAAEIESMITAIIHEEPEPQRQAGNPVFFPRRTPEGSDLGDASIQSLNDVFDFIRMLDAERSPPAFLDVHGDRMELSRIQMESDHLTGTLTIYRQEQMPNDGGGVKALLDRCYPKPPRDVFDRMCELYRPGDPLYTAEQEGAVIGTVYCARHSKGGHLESLAVAPEYRGLGLGERLVETLIADNPGVISLTTRIPAFFEPVGFRSVADLADGSRYMIHYPSLR